MATQPTYNSRTPIDADATPQLETRRNFAALYHALGLGPTLAVTGANAAATDLDPAQYGRFELSTDPDTGANDFDLMAPAVVGQVVTVILVAKDTQNATLTPDSGVTIVTAAGAAVASITLDANDEFAVLRAIDAARWSVVQTSGTVA